MSQPAIISPRIVEALYCEALVLSDEVRHAFTLSGRLERAELDEDLTRIALSSEGLRTTTRMMHAIAWLLNHRAYFMGEISQYQLQNYGRLAPMSRHSDPDQLALLDARVIDLIDRTCRLYDRLVRLDHSWRAIRHSGHSSGVESLRERIEQRLAG